MDKHSNYFRANQTHTLTQIESINNYLDTHKIRIYQAFIYLSFYDIHL